MKTKVEKSAGGIVYRNVDGQTLWLITQHSKHKGWVFPKGHIGDKDSTESMENAALREVEEEGGIKARIVNDDYIETSYRYQINGSMIKKTVYYFLMEYISGDPKNHDWEMMDAKFVTTSEVREILKYKSDQEAYEKALKRL